MEIYSIGYSLFLPMVKAPKTNNFGIVLYCPKHTLLFPVTMLALFVPSSLTFEKTDAAVLHLGTITDRPTSTYSSTELCHFIAGLILWITIKYFQDSTSTRLCLANVLVAAFVCSATALHLCDADKLLEVCILYIPTLKGPFVFVLCPRLTMKCKPMSKKLVTQANCIDLHCSNRPRALPVYYAFNKLHWHV